MLEKSLPYVGGGGVAGGHRAARAPKEAVDALRGRAATVRIVPGELNRFLQPDDEVRKDDPFRETLSERVAATRARQAGLGHGTAGFHGSPPTALSGSSQSRV